MIAKLLCLFSLVLLSLSPLSAADTDIVLTATSISLTKLDADTFLSAIGSGVVTKEQMAALLKRGKLTGTLVTRTKSGQRSRAGSDKMRFEADVYVKDDIAHVTIASEQGARQQKNHQSVLTLVALKIGTTQLLGVTDDPSSGDTHLFFISAQ